MPVRQQHQLQRVWAGLRYLLLVGVLIACAATYVTGLAQDPDSDLSIGGIDHTVVDGQHVIVVILNNSSSQEIEATGMLSIVDAGGLQVAQVDVTTGPLVPDGASVLAIPLPRALPDGRYSLTLMLLENPDEPPVQYGLRRFLVDEEGASAAFDEPGGGTGSGGFPSWLVLVGGLALIGIGMLFRRGHDEDARARPVPEVAMIRKVQVATRPKKGEARLRKLRPPDRQNRS